MGAKDSSGNFDNLKQYIEQTRGLDKEFSVLSGNDSLILPALVFGGKGGIAGCANVFPGTMVEIYEAYMAGDLERAMPGAGQHPASQSRVPVRQPQHDSQDCRRAPGLIPWAAAASRSASFPTREWRR